MNWIIENMKRNIDNGLVVEVSYRVVAKQGNLIADQQGKVTLTGDPNAEGFVPFENLTQAQVTQWVKDSVDVSAIEANVQTILDEKVVRVAAQTTKNGLPWGNKNILGRVA
jgi:hypothetical protein